MPKVDLQILKQKKNGNPKFLRSAVCVWPAGAVADAQQQHSTVEIGKTCVIIPYLGPYHTGKKNPSVFIFLV